MLKASVVLMTRSSKLRNATVDRTSERHVASDRPIGYLATSGLALWCSSVILGSVLMLDPVAITGNDPLRAAAFLASIDSEAAGREAVVDADA